MEISPDMKWDKDGNDEKVKKLVKSESFEDLNKPATWSDKINETLRDEIKATHDAYKAILVDKEKENDELCKIIDDDRESSDKIESLYKVQIDNLKSQVSELDVLNDQLKQENSTLISSEKDWIGRTLKMEFIFKKMIQAGAIQPDHSEWVLPMFEDIDIPHVPISTREEFVPTALTGVVGDSSDEDDNEEIINIIRVNPPNTRVLPRREHIERIVPTENISAEMIRDYFNHVYPETDDEELEDSFYGRAVTFDDVTVYPDPPGYDSLPWYLRRFPTPTENRAITIIQNAWRNRQ